MYNLGGISISDCDLKDSISRGAFKYYCAKIKCTSAL